MVDVNTKARTNMQLGGVPSVQRERVVVEFLGGGPDLDLICDTVSQGPWT